MSDTGFIEVGRVVKTHGLRGEVSVAPATDLPFVLSEGMTIWLVPPLVAGGALAVTSVRRGPKGPLVGISGVTDIDSAARLRGSRILVRESDVPESFTPDEFEPVGITVTDEERGLLGQVVEVIVTGANDVWVVHGPLGEVLLPDIDDVVLAVDEDARSATVRLLPGLLPDQGEST